MSVEDEPGPGRDERVCEAAGVPCGGFHRLLAPEGSPGSPGDSRRLHNPGPVVTEDHMARSSSLM